jgi:hypothetical protein
MKKIIIFAIISISYIISGCTALSPHPHSAQSFDTITLGIGPYEGMTKPNTQVYFTPDSTGVPVLLNPGIRAFFKIFADPTSFAYSTEYGFVDTGFKYLHQEPFETVVALDLPSLPAGTGSITFTTSVPTPQLLEPISLGPYPDLNTMSIPFEILPGTGSPNPFEYAVSSGGKLTGNLRALKQQRQALVAPPVEDLTSSWASTYGAIEFDINMPMTANVGGTLSEDSIRLVAQKVSTFTKSKSHMAWSYDGTTLKVIFLSESGKLRYYEPRFSIVADTADFDVTPSITSVSYFDVDGNVMFSAPGKADYTVSLLGLYTP